MMLQFKQVHIMRLAGLHNLVKKVLHRQRSFDKVSQLANLIRTKKTFCIFVSLSLCFFVVNSFMEVPMPKYTFQCRTCNTTFEEKRPFAHASDPATCPTCDSDNTKKLLNAVSFRVGGGSIPLDMATSGGGSCGCGSNCGCG